MTGYRVVRAPLVPVCLGVAATALLSGIAAVLLSEGLPTEAFAVLLAAASVLTITALGTYGVLSGGVSGV